MSVRDSLARPWIFINVIDYLLFISFVRFRVFNVFFGPKYHSPSECHVALNSDVSNGDMNASAMSFKAVSSGHS